MKTIIKKQHGLCCIETEDYYIAKRIMCKHFSEINTNKRCPLMKYMRDMYPPCACGIFEKQAPDMAIDIVQKWADDNIAFRTFDIFEMEV